MLKTPYDSDDVINDDDNVSVAVNEISFGRWTIHKNSTITFNATTACENVKRRTYEQNNHRKNKSNQPTKQTYTIHIQFVRRSNLFIVRTESAWVVWTEQLSRCCVSNKLPTHQMNVFVALKLNPIS